MPAVFATGVELSVPVINFSLWEALKTAKQQEQEVYHKIAARKEELCVQLIQLYYQHLFIKAISGINKSNGLSLQEVLRIIEARSRGGVVNPADLNRYKKLLLENEATAIDYQQQLEENDAAMHNLLNITSEVAIHISDSLSISTLQQLSEIINPEERPAYKAAQMARLVAEHQLTEAAKASYPKLNLTSRYTYQWQHSKESTVRFDAAAVGLKVEVPLFTGGVYKKQRLQAGLSLEAAQLTEQQTKASLQQQQQQWQAKYNASNRKAVLLKAELQLATENLRIALLHVKEGLMEYDEFNNIYIEYNQVQAAYFQNLADAIVYQLLLTNKF
jgi:outer membrane protein TolC